MTVTHNYMKNTIKGSRFGSAYLGFTIVELVIVIAIIGVLATIGIASFSSIKQGARNTQRSNSIKIIAETLEKYYIKNGEYPSCAMMTAQPASAVTTNTLKGMDSAVLTAPGVAVGVNSIDSTCSADPTDSTYSYVLVGNMYVLKYRDETSGSVISLNGRHGASIPPPAAPTVTNSTTASTTTWTWGTPTCVAGATATYQYDYTISPTGYDSGWVAIASNSVAFTTSTVSQTYTLNVQAKCATVYVSSPWSGSGVSSYTR